MKKIKRISLIMIAFVCFICFCFWLFFGFSFLFSFDPKQIEPETFETISELVIYSWKNIPIWIIILSIFLAVSFLPIFGKITKT